MAFAELMRDALPGLFQGLGEGGAGLLNTYTVGQNQLALEQARFQNMTNLQQQNQTFMQNQALAGQNFQATQNQSNRDLTTNLQSNSFTNASRLQSNAHVNAMAMQANSQNFLTAQQKSNQEFSSAQLDKSMAFNRNTNLMSTGANFAGSLISGGLNFVYAKSLMNTQASLQRENFDYMTGKATSALATAGLPSWLAFMPGASSFPKSSQAVSGNNFYSSSLPGNSSQLLWTGSSSQLAFGTGDIPQAV